jgi:integrase
MQRGQIFRKGSSWFVRYWDTVMKNGIPTRRRICRRIAPYCDRYRTKSSVKPLADEILSPINSGRACAESTLAVDDYIARYYLPAVRQQKRPSTYKCYRDFFENHLKGKTNIPLRDFRCVDGNRLLAIVAHNADLGHTMLKHIKSFLSGAFTFAKREGTLDGINPMRDTAIPEGKQSGDTYAYSLEEIEKMLVATTEPARTAIALAAFTGLRHSEIRGLQWEDFTGDEIKVCRTVWNRHVNAPKTKASAASVPVLPFLCRVLAEHRKRNAGDGYIFAGPKGAPLNLANLVRRVIKESLKDSGVEWQGWHAFRRGLATNLYRLGVPERTIQAIMRHANIATTLAFYVKPVSSDSHAAMAKMEKALGNDWATARKTYAS